MKKIILLFSVILFLFISCVSTPGVKSSAMHDSAHSTPVSASESFDSSEKREKNTDFIPARFDWKNITDGVEMYTFTSKEIPLIYYAVKIDLSKNKFTLASYPDTDTAVKDGFYQARKTSAFAKINKCAVAVNAAPFERKGVSKVSAIGIHKIRGTVLSKTASRYGAVAFSSDAEGCITQCAIVSKQSDDVLSTYDSAFGGFFAVLVDGVEQSFAAQTFDSRSGIGVSADGRTIYLLVAEGEEKIKSRGLSYQECAKIFKAMSCSSALELDGGSSSDLCINGKSILSYSSTVAQGSNFGFCIKNSF